VLELFRNRRVRVILALALIAAVIFSSMQTAMAAVNIINNGTFQTDITTGPWTASATGSTTVAWNASGQANGGAVVFRNSVDRNPASATLRQTFTLNKPATRDVNFSFWYKKQKSTGNAPRAFTARVRIIKPNNTDAYNQSYTGTANVAWTQGGITILKNQFSATGTYTVELYANIENDGNNPWAEVWFDEIFLEIDQVNPDSVPDLNGTAVSESQINLTWTGVQDNNGSGQVAYYDVYRDGVRIATNIPHNGLVQHSYTATGLTTGQNYTFEVKAVDTWDNISTNNSTVTMSTIDTTKPNSVTPLTATPVSDSRIDLQWNGVGDNIGVTSYDIFKNNVYLATVSHLGVGVSHTYPVTGLSPSTTYNFEVRAKDAAGNVSINNDVKSATTLAPADTTPPNPVTSLTATAVSGTRIDLQWNQGSDNTGGSGVVQYLVYRNSTQIGEVAESGSLTYSYQVTGLSPNTSYNFEIKAKDAAGNISSGNNVVPKATLSADTTPPSSVTSLAANTLSHSSIRLTWSESTDTGYGVASYEIIQNNNPTPIANILHNGNPTYSYDVNGLSPSTTYNFEVRAVDKDGNRSADNIPASATTNPTPDSTPPSSVQSLTATPLSAKRIELEWGKATDNIGVDHYEIYQDGSPTPIASVPDGGATTFRYSVLGLNPLTLYTFEVKAVDAIGNKSASNATASATTLALTDPTVPSSVYDLTAQAVSTSRVKLTWSAATDNIGVTEYQILQNGSLKSVIKDNGAPTFSYYAGGLNPFTTYTFEIVAVDKEGNLSTGNNQVSVSTLAADNTAPTVPSGLTVSYNGSNRVSLAWQASSDNVGVNKYKIYRSENGGAYKLVGTSTVASFTNAGLRSSTPYSFKVSAVDAAGNESAASVVNTTTIADSSAPLIIRYEPWVDEVDIGQASSVKVTLDDGLNEATVNGTTVYLKDNNNVSVSSAVYYDDTTGTIVLTPSANLTQGMKYTTYVVGGAGGVKNSANIPLAKTFSWSFTVGSTAFNIAHGNYTTDTSKCKLCHTLHNGKSDRMLNESTQTGMCFTCHDGTAASNNIASIFAADSGNITYHPVKDTELAAGELIRCSDCHNPHGNFNSGTGTFYPKLLRAFNGTGYVNQGPEFCLACHGAVNRSWSAVYYSNTLGNHSNPNAAHYDPSKPALAPASGTKVTCVMCHDKHASSNNRLIREDRGTEDTLCFNCHNNSANSLSSRNIFDEFNRTGSRHNIFDNDQADGSRVECRSCHGPHTVGPARHAAGAVYADISDPDNTYNFFTKVTGSRNTPGRLSEFCIKCHDGTPPQKSMVYTDSPFSTTQVPFTVRFPGNPAVNFTSNNSGWNKNVYPSSGHYNRQVECDNCHEQHGSDYPRLQRRPEDTSDAITGKQICLSCHDGSYTGAPDIRTDIIKANAHPTLTYSGRHSDTEDYAGMSNRHAECVDCHDPHSAKADTVTTPPNSSGILLNTSGVAVGSRGAWTSSASDFTFKKNTTYQYELCYKCHSSFAGTTPTRDIAKEFNPANKTFHPVEGNSPNTKGFFVNGYGPNSRLWCTDCHGREGGTGPRGPHGSANPKILKAKYDANTGAGTNTDLCFRCHSYNDYATSGGNDTNQTGFWDGGKNLHARHASKFTIRCQYCHSGVVHGTNSNKRLIVTTSDVVPYKTSSTKIKIYTDPGTGNYSTNSCSFAAGTSPCASAHPTN